MSAANKLLVQKLVIAFVVSFVGALLTSLEGLSRQPDFGWDRSLVISVIVGALGVGMRAVLALGPVSLVPSDATHSLVGKKA